jgi:hypothetical protein
MYKPIFESVYYSIVKVGINRYCLTGRVSDPFETYFCYDYSNGRLSIIFDPVNIESLNTIRRVPIAAFHRAQEDYLEPKEEEEAEPA